MEPINLDKNIGLLLYDVSRLLRRRMDQRLKSDGLTRGQWSVLVHLSRFEGINQISLAEILEIEPISLVRILDRLEMAGWIERRTDPADRRARLLYLRPEAGDALKSVWALGAEVRQESLEGVSSTEQSQLIEILQRMKENLSDKEGASCRQKLRKEHNNG